MPAAAPHIVLMLSLLLGLQPITTDLYLPALPALATDLGASMQQAQLTLTALLLPFGLSQLVWGPLSDRYGRRPVLLVGLGLYVIASLASVWVATMHDLIICRAVQGLAMGACVMCARAIVRDAYPPEEGARVMSKALSGLGVLACLSAPLGGLLADWAGWRAALSGVAVFGILTLAVLGWRFTETCTTPNPQALVPRVWINNWRSIVGNPTFVAYSALSTAAYGVLFVFLAGSSFVFIGTLGVSRTVYGLLMCSMSLAYIGGTFLCRRLLLAVGVRRTVAVGGALSLTGGLGMALLAWLGQGHTWYGAWAIMLPQYFIMLGHGIHQPCGQSGAVGPFPHAAGAASALNGFVMMLTAFITGQWLGVALNGTVFPMVLGIAAWSLALAAAAWTLVQRHGHPVTRP
jgi:MFS transporter, DHA1 family, multidrug resistance protein